jgi:hypothetical protein
MKQCKLCGKNKSRTEFYKKKGGKDGLFTICKECHKEKQRKRYSTPEYRDWNRKRVSKKEYKEKMHPYFQEYEKKRDRKESVKTSEKRRARVQLGIAVEAGHIDKPNFCEECKKECNPQGHHHDYAKPLEVKWLCQSCHMKKHRKD